ncbi:uncharacterized protein [Danio rerio]|uniref:RRM domain-containing protein n=1 Tax=Danio rerio TaxID=7955 RepID=A0A8M3B2X6_DANRE|nr:uncharacterized protein LOC103908610 [Danio rerio]|eukprot:XP_009291892.2 uncharacterized protein LOC103908610 [Danio rerio]
MDAHLNQSSDNHNREWSLVVLTLDPKVNVQELIESMKQFTQIHSLDLSYDEDNNCRSIYVTFEHSGREQEPHPVLPTYHYIERKTLLVSNLHPMVTEQQLIEKFGPLGSISTVQVCRNNIVSPVYAFVTFHHRLDAVRAQKALNFTHLLNKPLIIMWGPDKTTEVLSDYDSSSQRQTEEREAAGETEEKKTSGETEREAAGETEERANSESSWRRRISNNVKSAVKATVSSPATWVGVGIGVCAAYAYFRSRS